MKKILALLLVLIFAQQAQAQTAPPPAATLEQRVAQLEQQFQQVVNYLNRVSGQIGNMEQMLANIELDVKLNPPPAYQIGGSPDAKVVVVEFSDYECPYCSRFAVNEGVKVDSALVETGKIQKVFMDFPLSFHPKAVPAAKAARCAGEQGKYFEMHDVLFKNPAILTDLTTAATQVGLNMATYNTCFARPELDAEINSTMQEGVRVGINATPTVAIGMRNADGSIKITKFMKGASFQSISAAVEALMNK